MVEMFGYGVIGIIGMLVVGYLLMNFGLKDKEGETTTDGVKGFGNYIIMVVFICIFVSAMVKCG